MVGFLITTVFLTPAFVAPPPPPTSRLFPTGVNATVNTGKPIGTEVVRPSFIVRFLIFFCYDLDALESNGQYSIDRL